MNPIWWGVIAAFAWGTSDLISRITSRRLGPIGAMWGLSVSGLLSASVLLALYPALLPHALPAWIWLLGASLAAMLAPIIFFRGLSLGPMALVAPLAAAYPVWVLPIAMVEGFRPPPIAWLAMGLVALGAVVVARTAPHDPDEAISANPANKRAAIIAALLASLAFAATVIAGRGAAARVGSVLTLWSSRLGGSVLIALARPWRGRPAFATKRMWALLLLQALFDNAAFVSLYIGSQHGGAAMVSIASSAFMVVGVLLAAIFLKERPNVSCVAGAGAVFCGIALLAAVGP